MRGSPSSAPSRACSVESSSCASSTIATRRRCARGRSTTSRTAAATRGARGGLRRTGELLRGARRGARVSALHAAGRVPRLGGTGRAAVGRPRAGRGLAAGAGEMSDDWGRYRSGLGDEEEGQEDEKDLGGEEPGGWPEDEPGTGKTHWAEDEPEPGRESESGWPSPGPTWQRPEYGGTHRPWEQTG